MPINKSIYKDFTILQGDCMNRLIELENNSIDTIFADPPYFLSNGGISCQSGKVVCVDKGDWDKGGTPEYIYEFNRRWLELCRPKLKDNGTIWISGTHHNIFVVQRCLQELGYKILNTITWQKSDPPPNLSCRYFNFSTELIIWARKNEKIPHKFNYEKMKQMNGGKQMTDVWRLPAVGMWEKSYGKHPTQKPLRLLYRIIMASTDKNDTVLDPFAGSSTTGIAANLLGRKFIGIEKEKQFVELSLRRRSDLDDPAKRVKLIENIKKLDTDVMVLVNHARAEMRKLMIEKGLCYLRIGDSKGSLLVHSEFLRLGFVLLHTNGEQQQLFKLKNGASYKIYTKEELQALGFDAQNAPCYAVLQFDNTHPIKMDYTVDLQEGKKTFVAKVRPLSDFLE